MRLLAWTLAVVVALPGLSLAAAPRHRKKAKKRGYDYAASQYKDYKVLTGGAHYRFDKDGNPIAASKRLKVRRHRKKAAAPAAAPHYAPAHFPGSIANPDAPASPAAGPAAGQAAQAAGAPPACAGDVCSQGATPQIPASQP